MAQASKKRNPLTTRGWVQKQADSIIESVENILITRGIDKNDFILIVSSNVVHSICDISVLSRDDRGIVVNSNALIDEKFSPFRSEEYWSIVEKCLKKAFGFKYISKNPNVFRYEFRQKD